MNFNLQQALALVEAFGGDEETIVTVTVGGPDAHSGAGLYAHYQDYPEEGSTFLGQYE